MLHKAAWARIGNEGQHTSIPTLMPPAFLILVLTAAGLAGFGLFYKSVDFFDHI